MIQYTVSRVPASESIKNEVIIAANFAKNRLPANTVFGMSDAGIFRLISERKTIGFNGLIANRDILQLVLNKQYATIVDRYNVEYYVLPLPAYKLERLAIKPVYLSKKFMYNWLKGGTEEGYVAIFPAKDIFKVIGPNP
jgi:hypothetical protein